MPDREMDRPVVRGSGDIFADLDLALSQEDRVKLEIAREITRVIVAKGYTQTDAAKIIGADQAKVSKISRGLVADFSIDRLLTFLAALGIDVNIRTSNAKSPRGRMTVTSLAATG